MKRSDGRILTTHVGSLPRPSDLAAMLMGGAMKGTPEQRATFYARSLSATKEAVEKQVAAGIDVVSDGEQGKIGFVNYVKDRLDGFDGETTPFRAADLVEFPGMAGGGGAARAVAAAQASGAPTPNLTPACSGPISYRDHDAYTQDIANFKAGLQGAKVEEAFMCAISPGNVLQVLGNQYYPTRRDYLYAVADAMKPEYKAIADAGLILQMDACDLAMDRHVNFANSSVEVFRAIINENVEALNYSTEGIPTDRIRLHLCWGNYQGPHHKDVDLKDIVDIVLKVRCGGVSFEAANPRHVHEWQLWREVKVPQDMVLIPGVIDTNSTYIEHPEAVAERIANFASIVGPERVIASTDCGFGTFVYLTVPEQLAYAKLKTLAEGAAIASKRLFWRRTKSA